MPMPLAVSSATQSCVSQRPHTFPSAFRLKRRRLIRALFDRERTDVASVAAGSVRLVYRFASLEEVGQAVPVQFGFAVGRRTGGAVTRNRIKRLLRETVRVHRHLLTEPLAGRPDTLTVMILFRGNAERAGQDVQEDMLRALRHLAKRLAA